MQGPCSRRTIAAISLLAFAAGCGEAAGTPSPHPSNHLTAQGTNYLAAQTNILTQLGIGVATAKIGAPSSTRFSASVNGVQAAATVLYGKTQRTATNFTADYVATKSTASPGRKKLRASGSIFLAFLGPAVQQTSSSTSSGSATTLQFNGQTESVTLAAATTGKGVIFSVGSGNGGTIRVIGNQVIVKDGGGSTVGQHPFDSDDDIEGNIASIINADVLPPSPKVVASACASENAISVSNSKIFEVAQDSQVSASTSSSTDVFQILAIKSSEVDCKTRAATTHTSIDVIGEQSGQDFQAIYLSPPRHLTAPPDDTPVPPSPVVTNFTPDPSQTFWLPPQVPDSGRGRSTPAPIAQSFDGSYTGKYSGSYVNSMGTFAPSGPFAFTVSNGLMTVTLPGSGSGRVSTSGAAGVHANNATMAVGGLGVSGLSVEFTAQFSVAGTTKTATGTWQCSGPQGGTGSGSWSATAQ